MILYKFRPLGIQKDLDRIQSIFEKGFYCSNFLDFNDIHEGVYTVSEIPISITLNQKLKHRICSFSIEAALKSQLMWGHYANAGMGVAIELDTKDCTEIKKVHYGNGENRYNTLIEILTNKSAQWIHEAEYRYISTDSNKYYKTAIKKVYFGFPYGNLINYNEIKTKHTKLKEFLYYSKKLKTICSGKGITFEKYEFSK